MTRIFLIGFAGALGTLARYFIGQWASRTLGAGFPWGTLIVNVAGCFLIALVMHVALTTSTISQTLRLTLTTGFMGGLTTYSSFNLETMTLLRERSWGWGIANIVATLAACFLAGAAGLLTAKRLLGE